MTENRPAITVDQFTELCRILANVNEGSLAEYDKYKKKEWETSKQPQKTHREWAIYILSELGLSLQIGDDTGKFLESQGVQAHSFTD
ncbi:hypothetical protein [Streptomyces cinereoruber]|uniref:hypothetical protein n=1 Tax=Streptomyces cinereoruber TaxID=67260 RepID=UPI00363174EF